MPELPDVEIFKRYIDSTALHKRITDVIVEDDYVLKYISIDSLKNSLRGQEFDSTFRHGKYLFFKLSSCHTFLMHFGMTGFPKYFKNEEEKPDHVRLFISFGNNYSLAYDCQRKLGEIRLIEDAETFIDDLEMGPDALDEDLDLKSFLKLFEGRRGMIKPALMNQEIIAGIGNVYSDEILFQSGIHPKSKVKNLSEDDRKKIYDQMHEVLNTAIDCRVDRTLFPDHYILSDRSEGADCPKEGCGGTLQSIKVSGRNAIYCPSCQKKK